MQMTEPNTQQPLEVFPMWRRAQLEVDLRSHEAPPSPFLLRTRSS